MKAPDSIQLPSGLVVEVLREDPARRPGHAPGDAGESPELFSELSRLLESGDLRLQTSGGADVPLGELALCDFHALRAIATRLDWLSEEEIEIECGNCNAVIRTAPCASLPLGPFADRELDDPDLDRRLDLTQPHPVPPIAVRRAGAERCTARDVRLTPLTVAAARPLFRALGKRRFVVTEAVVRAMGIAALGPEKSPRRIAASLVRCSDEAWDTVTDLFLRAHYPPRLFSALGCAKCGARNDVDAPFDREFIPSRAAHQGSRSLPAVSPKSNAEPFPTFDEFDARAQAIAAEMLAEHAQGIVFVVEGGVPACDEGGEPLLGAYDPPVEGDPMTPSRQAEITVFYRTFRAVWDEEGNYDWQAELEETVEHELEHHVAHLAGGDPVDEAERRAIDEEARRVLGRREVVRASARALGGDVRGFVARTWPFWLILVLAALIVLIFGR